MNIDITKPMPIRTQDDRQNENRIINYLLNADHCTVKSPISEVIQFQPSTNTFEQSTGQKTDW